MNRRDSLSLFFSFFLFMQEKFSAVIFANLRPANAISITFPLLRDTSMLGVQFAAGASGSRDKQSIGYTRVYIFHLCLSVHACRACGNKLIKLLVRVMRSTRPWMEICAFPFKPGWGEGIDPGSRGAGRPSSVNDTN